MKKKPMPLWVKVTIPITITEMMEYVGPQCPSYDKDCSTCRAWTHFRRNGRIQTLVERNIVLGTEGQEV